MKSPTILFLMIFLSAFVRSQEVTKVNGTVMEMTTNQVISNTTIVLEGLPLEYTTDESGDFNITINRDGEFILQITSPDFEPKRIPIFLEGNEIDLGTIFLRRDITFEKSINLVNLTEDELLDDDASSNTLALLQSTKDIFLNRAAFDFGQAFYRIRGYDSQYGEVFLNGLPMNKMYDGRPQWNNWGGLNDVIRNQQYANGLNASDFTFGGILGNTNIDLRPSGLRPGTRISSSMSNRTYTGRLMATYNSGVQNEKWAYILSASRRWAKEGYIDGTLYDAYSLYGAVEYLFDKSNSVSFTSILASNRRGRSSAITEEVFELVGNQYNPYWGEQNGEIRNSRERHIQEPLFLLNYVHESTGLKISAGLSYQTGFYKRGRLGYYNAPNPDPTYYRYLPSFYINSPIGANFESAQVARNGFLRSPQLDWNQVYTANTSLSQNGKAAYVLYDDTVQDNQISARFNSNIAINENIRWDLGFTYQDLSSHNYAKINDLFGADYHEDIDPFSVTKNDINSEVNKDSGEIFNYNYELLGQRLELYSQLNGNFNKFKGFLSGKFWLRGTKEMGFTKMNVFWIIH